MKKYILIIISIVFTITNSFSQVYIKDLQGIKKIKILEIYGNLNIEGVSTSKIQVGKESKKELPVDANLAKPEYFKNENTNIGLCFEHDDGIVTISPANQEAQFTIYKLQIPRNAMLEIKTESLDEQIEITDTKNTEIFNEIVVKNLNAEINIEVFASEIELYNITGPLALALFSGNLYIDFLELNQQYPSTIELFTGNVDVLLPKSAKFDIQIENGIGDIHSEFEIDIMELKPLKSGVTLEGRLADKTENTGEKIDASKIIGKVNNGGTKLSINTFVGNINLKKK